jgi:hypothetical protein
MIISLVLFRRMKIWDKNRGFFVDNVSAIEADFFYLVACPCFLYGFGRTPAVVPRQARDYGGQVRNSN